VRDRLDEQLAGNVAFTDITDQMIDLRNTDRRAIDS